LSRCVPDGSIKSDAHTRSTNKSEKRRPRLTVQIDHQIVLHTADLLQQIEKRHQRAPPAAALRKIAPREKKHIRERRMTAHELSVLRRDEPVNPRFGITRTQLHKYRHRVHYVTQAG